MSPIKKSIVRRFFAWSFSRYCDWRECPAKAAYKHLDKLEPFQKDDAKVEQLVQARTKGAMKCLPLNTEPTIKGSVVHVMAEQFTQGKLKRLPAELATFKKEFVELKKKPTNEEQQWAFTEDWRPADWFGRDAWLRVVVDEHFVEGRGGKIIDYKTGKAPSAPDAKSPSWNNDKFYSHREQREIYAIALFIMYPDIVDVAAEHWYVDSGVLETSSYTRARDFDALKKKWTRQVRGMMNDKRFAPRPSIQACKFCPFANSRGGPCAHG